MIHTIARPRRVTVLVLSGILGMIILGAPGATLAQDSPCQLLAAQELAEATGAPFGTGEPTDDGCRWMTETADGHVITITLDVTVEPLTVTVTTDDPDIDASALGAALGALAAERQASGQVAPTPAPAAPSGDRPDLCALFSAERISQMLQVAMVSYGGPDACGWRSDDLEHILPGALVAFERGELDGKLTLWPDATATEVEGMPALEYGFDIDGTASSRYLTVDLGDGVLTAQVTSDLDEVDAAGLALQLVLETLAAMG